jgi:hypothetical protein
LLKARSGVGITVARKDPRPNFRLNFGLESHKRSNERFGDNTLWIITEGDRSVTTFLLPDEY